MSTMGLRSFTIKDGLHIYDDLKGKLLSTGKVNEVYFGGSLCRHQTEVDRLINDIDLVILTDDGRIPFESREFLKDHKFLRFGNKKASILYENELQIDLNATTNDCLGPCMLTQIGDSIFNVSMRGRAKEMNYKLNEYGLYDRATNQLVTNSVAEIFKLLNLEYIDPSKRSFRENGDWLNNYILK